MEKFNEKVEEFKKNYYYIKTGKGGKSEKEKS